MAVKEPVQDQEALLKALKLMAVMSTAADTHKNILFAGKKGSDKYKNTDFSDQDSILENAVEGTDVMENIGFKEGGLPAYTAGTLYDIFNPVNLGISAASKAGKAMGTLAKLLSPLETATEEVGKKVVKSNLPKYLKKEMRHTKNFPLAERMADEAIETGVSKKLSSPEKALAILRGKKEMKTVGGTEALPISRLDKSEGTMDKVGKELADTVSSESKIAKKVNKGQIFREEMDKVKTKNAKGVDYQLNENTHEKVLSDALSPSEMRRVSFPNPAKASAKDAEKIDLDLEALDDLLGRKKEARKSKYFTSAEEPPPVPRETPPPVEAAAYNDMGLEEIMAELSNKKAAKASVAKVQDLPDEIFRDIEVDSVATLQELWEKKVSLRKMFKDSTLGKPMSEWTDKDRALEGIIDNIDERISAGMSKPGADAYAGLNEKYASQAKLAQILEDQLQAKGGTAGQAARGAAEIASGGAMNPGTVGRGAKGIVDSLTGPKRKVQLGNLMQERKLSTPGYEALSEAAEVPFDEPYLEDSTDRTEDSPVDFSGVPSSEEPTEEVDMNEADVDFSGVPSSEGNRSPQSVPEEMPTDSINMKMDETLTPQKPMWDPYINEEVLNTFLPRDSKRILANPTALMAKIHQVAPNQVPVFQEMLDNDQEAMVEAAPKLAMMFPAVFEKDKYGTFDGKILDPMMQQKFLMDLSEDEEMDSIAKSELAMKVQRGESIHS